VLGNETGWNQTMPVHDWSRVDAGIFHALHTVWCSRLQEGQLPADELTAFARWFEEYLADAWDRRIDADVQAGRLDAAVRRADADFEAGRCTPL
jgi:hypothetical protein